ncbi:hypothetical protein K458DRAFT_383388 [Lentithecium fluviatile CBS 122367]|uniref:Uncharacterized protein n=1 Tax=Lentithecium fluviatile CBS 122367 TaxID=1168545 RepID=A0A6G1JI97_9PLEO|nr:hypothetical protein K458DRAFT_383388 [Lentithecium fluviatile CBS 122367]
MTIPPRLGKRERAAWSHMRSWDGWIASRHLGSRRSKFTVEILTQKIAWYKSGTTATGRPTNASTQRDTERPATNATARPTYSCRSQLPHPLKPSPPSQTPTAKSLPQTGKTTHNPQWDLGSSRRVSWTLQNPNILGYSVVLINRNLHREPSGSLTVFQQQADDPERTWYDWIVTMEGLDQTPTSEVFF